MSHRHSRHTPRVRLRARLGGLLRALTALTAGGAVLIAAPAAMWHFVGWPLPDHIPTWNEIAAGATAPLTEGLVLGLIGCLFWYAYTLLALSVAVEITATAGGWSRPRLPTAGPAQALAAVLVGTILTGVLTAATRATPAPPTTAVLTAYRQAAPVTAPADPTSHAKQLAAAGSAASTGPSCTVAVHDSLWSLAEVWLGDGLRWRDIWTLNEGRIQADGTELTSPDLLRPGWVLHLPPDARPPTPPAPPDTAAPPAPASGAPAPAPVPAPPDPTAPVTPSAPPRSTVPPGWTPTIPPAPRPPGPPTTAPTPAPH
ncbi:LysM peptidoglycan-binding domain-containing protein, partial [Frankia sp. Cpl3]|nr:LysM peptidoglycan-binding domain-containing protein [Frankia sp. Cpl3]